MKNNPTPPNPPPQLPTAEQLQNASYAIGETNTGITVLMVAHGAIQLQILIPNDIAQKLGDTMSATGKKLAEAGGKPALIVPPIGTFKIPNS